MEMYNMVKIVSDNHSLLKVFKPFQIMFDDGRFVFDKDGMKCTVVNTSHTAMLHMTVDKKFFKQYKVSKEEKIGIDISNLISILEKKTFKKMPHETSITLIEGWNVKGNIEINGKKIKYNRDFNLLDAKDMTMPKIPSLELKYKYEIQDFELLKLIIEDIKSEASWIKVATINGNLSLKGIQNNDNGDSTYKFKEPEAKCIESDVGGFESLYEVIEFWYFIWGLMKTFGKPVVTIESDTDYPIRVSAKNKHIEMIYLLAPRIEST